MWASTPLSSALPASTSAARRPGLRSSRGGTPTSDSAACISSQACNSGGGPEVAGPPPPPGPLPALDPGPGVQGAAAASRAAMSTPSWVTARCVSRLGARRPPYSVKYLRGGEGGGGGGVMQSLAWRGKRQWAWPPKGEKGRHPTHPPTPVVQWVWLRAGRAAPPKPAATHVLVIHLAIVRAHAAMERESACFGVSARAR